MDAGETEPTVYEPPEQEDAYVGVEVVGPVHAARFPDVCICCGGAAGGSLRVTKLFRRTGDDGPNHYEPAEVRAPACDGCIRRHRAERTPIDRAVRRRLLWKWALEASPYVVPLGVCLFFMTVVVPRLFRSVDWAGASWDVLIGVGVAGFFAFLTWTFVRLIRSRGALLIAEPGQPSHELAVQVERGPLGCRFVLPAEPTSVSGALDFSDDRSDAFDPERHLFRFRNRQVAESFEALNAGRAWDPASPRAIRGAMLRKAAMAAVVGFILYQVGMELLRWLRA